MSRRARARRDATAIAHEEAGLARRVATGDRAAFDLLFDRYFARVARFYRDLPPEQAQAAIWQALEQVFAGLDCEEDLAARAYRIARR